jgi:hypothetical protein
MSYLCHLVAGSQTDSDQSNQSEKFIVVLRDVRNVHLIAWSLRPNSWTKSRQKSSEFSSLLLTVTSTAYFSKLTQPLTISVKAKGRKPDIKPYPLPYGLRNPYRNLQSENSQD